MELWLPDSAKDKVAVQGAARRHLPGERKKDGGSFFDDELETEESVQQRVARQTQELIAHLNARPDHHVFVGSVESRSKMRAAFNVWFKHKLIGHNPTIEIDYGVPDDGVRIAEPR